MAGEAAWALEPMRLPACASASRKALPLENLDDTVGKRFPAALDRLEKAGARLSNEKLPLIDDMMRRCRAPAFWWPRSIPSTATGWRGAAPTSTRSCARASRRAATFRPADYIEVMRARAALIRAMDARLADLDVLVMPTTPTVAPRLDEVADPKAFMARNAMLLRNTTIGNFFDCCAISLPLPRDGGLPAGLMLVARNGHDHRLFRIAAAVERLLAA